jgi:hypothetical protein
MPSVAIGLHVGSLADHQVMAHDVLRQAAGVGQFDGERLQLLSTVISLVLKDIWSVESTVTEHSAATEALARVSRDTATAFANIMNLLGRVLSIARLPETVRPLLI